MLLFLDALGFALLPAIGILIGSFLAESIRTPKWLIGASLHATAGIAIALVSIDVMPRILVMSPTWLIAIAFFIGAGISVLIANVWGSFRHRPGSGTVGAWMVYLAVATDLISDGLMVSAGTAVEAQLGFLFAATQTVANVPGGFAAASNFQDDGMPRRKRLALTVSLLIPALLSAGLGYLVLRGASAAVHGAALALFTGILLLATVEDVIPQGDDPEPPRWVSTAAFAGGFVVLALLSELLP
ncbi:MAG: ZIP family metal transporter [Hyphomicrobiaceae bacterium]